MTINLKEAYRQIAELGGLGSAQAYFIAGVAYGALAARMSQEEIVAMVREALAKERSQP